MNQSQWLACEDKQRSVLYLATDAETFFRVDNHNQSVLRVWPPDNNDDDGRGGGGGGDRGRGDGDEWPVVACVQRSE